MTENMVTLVEIEAVWGNANFGAEGNANKMGVVKMGLLKCASGYHQGSTSRAICTALGLITEKYNLTKRGRYCLYEFFKGPESEE
jgi:hypothetical protein